MCLLSTILRPRYVSTVHTLMRWESRPETFGLPISWQWSQGVLQKKKKEWINTKQKKNRERHKKHYKVQTQIKTYATVCVQTIYTPI